MKPNKITYYKFLSIALLVLVILACKKEEFTSDVNLSRQFSTGVIDFKEKTETSVKLVWSPSLFTTPGNVKYTVEVSKDSLFQSSADYTVDTDTSGVIITEDNILVRQKYFARVKTNGENETNDSKWVYSDSFSITGEQIFLPIPSSQISSTTAILSWKVLSGLTKITLTPKSGAIIEIPLSETEAAAGFKLVTDLSPETSYRADIFQSNRIKGFLSFATKPAISGVIVDLTAITDRASVLADTIPLIPSGSTIILKRGLTYDITSTLYLTKSVSIVSDEDLTNPVYPKINLSSNFNIEEGSVIDSIIFRNVDLYSEDGYSSKYVFNISKANNIGKIAFDGCRISVFRGVTRLQSATMVLDEFSVNNCVIDNISNYGVINADNVKCQVNNIKIMNSTISRCQKFITSKQNSTSILIDNSTIVQSPLGGNYIIDYSTSPSNNVSSGIKINNTIFGIGGDASGTTANKGVRVSATTLVELSNTFATSDFASSSNPITGIKVYSGTSSDLFVDYLNADYTIKDSEFAGKDTSGDPRWR